MDVYLAKSALGEARGRVAGADTGDRGSPERRAPRAPGAALRRARRGQARPVPEAEGARHGAPAAARGESARAPLRAALRAPSLARGGARAAHERRLALGRGR